jgi:hypothetical protein
MGKQRAKIITKTAFEKAFVEAEILMRKALSDMIAKEILKETNPATIVGLKKAQEIVIGQKVE